MEWLAAENLGSARWLLGRLIAALYALAFANAAWHWPGLLGDDGLTPVRRRLERLDPWSSPTVFAWRYSDRLALAACWSGFAAALVLVVGLPQQAPSWVPLVVWLLLWALYLSIVNVGQIWYAFGWETILLEAGFFAAFLGGDQVVASWASILMIRWLLFRVEFGAGLIKLRGDPCWRDLTCLEYHHETQPMPGPLSRLAHQQPRWWHRVEVAGNHITQLVVPFGLFGPQPVAGVAALLIILTQGWLVVTGNFAWLNVLTMVLAVSAIPDGWLAWLPIETAGSGFLPSWFGMLTLLVAGVVAVLSWWPIRNLASRRQAMNTSFNRLRLVGSYGAFGAINRTRYEVVIEGTEDDPEDPEATWKAYEFPGKPGDVHRRPPQVAPWHLRLDWLLWFAAMHSRAPLAGPHRWFRSLVVALLEGRPVMQRLLRGDPFDGRAPRAIRARRFRYEFTSRSQRRETGSVWTREEVGMYLEPTGVER